MSTYHPKTLKRWKAHKRSLLDLRDKLPPEPQPPLRSSVIHSLDDANALNRSGYGLRKERYRLEDSRSRSVHFSNGFRKVLREQTGLAFSKVVSEEHFIRVDFAEQESGIQRTSPQRCLPKMAPKRKKLIMLHNPTRKPLPGNVLKDLLQVVPSGPFEPLEVLQTDGQEGNLRLLEDEGFSPYRVIKQQKNQPSPFPKPMREIGEKSLSKRKFEDLTSESIANFMSISEIDLKAKHKLRLIGSKKRSFSVVEIVMKCRRETQCSRYSKPVNTQIEPWQTEK